MPADPLTADEDLRRCLDALGFLETLGLCLVMQGMVVDGVAVLLQQMQRAQPPGAGMGVIDHAIDRGLFHGGVHDALLVVWRLSRLYVGSVAWSGVKR